MKFFLTFLLLPLCLMADDFANRTENKIYRAEVLPHWLPDDSALWYRVQTGEKTHEFVQIDTATGQRRTASTLKDLGLPDSPPRRTSTDVIRQRHTQRTGGESGLVFVNETTSAVKLFWLNTKGKRVTYDELKPGETRQQHTYEGHVWLISTTTDEPLAIIEAEALVQTWIIDGKGKNPPKSPASTRGKPSPNGQWRIYTEAEKETPRQVTIVESSPKDQVQPRLKTFDYIKPGDPLPKPIWVIAGKDAQTRQVEDTLYPNPFSPSGTLDAIWSPDSREFYFDYNQRGHQLYRILAVDPETGDCRIVVEETSKTFIDYTKKTWRHWLHTSNELLWMSERDGWCHLYLYDSHTGAVKNQVTKGSRLVREVLHVDEAQRQVWFLASGLRAEEDPYHLHLCRVNFDGSGFIQLTEGDGSHSIAFSPQRRFFTATWSRTDHAPVNELRRSADGSLVAVLEKADASSLLFAGWVMPERFVAKARDDKTDIHGILIKPADFNPAKKYPIIEDIYAGPHSAFAPKTFDRMNRLQALAQRGFVVVKLDGMGTNHRGKAFHDVCWKNLKDSGFPDRKKWITEAAKTRPWMDLSRIGIIGGSAGGQSAMRALLDHHEFYKVAVADCGCHDNRMDKIWWNEQWMGWPVDESYITNSNSEDAHKLQGHLLLIVGELDTNVDPASTTQVVAALQLAGKTFDYMPIINTGHGAAETAFGSQLRMEFLIRHLKP